MRRTFVILIALTASVPLVSCAAMQAVEEQERAAAFKKQADADMEFCRQQWETPELVPIHSRWSYRADLITPLMFGHEQPPTQSEAGLLKKYLVGRGWCLTRVRSTMATFYPLGLAQFDTAKFRTDLVLAELVNRRITWGNGARLAYQAYLEATNQFTEAARRDMERREALAVERAKANAHLVSGLANAAAGAAQRPAPVSPSTIGITNCRWLGSTLNCTSF